jgi:O-antigen ligase
VGNEQVSSPDPRRNHEGTLHRAVAFLGEPSSWVALAVLALSWSSPSGPAEGAQVTLSDLLLMAAAVSAGLQLLRGRGWSVVRSVPAVAFLVLASLTVLSAVLAPDFPESLVGAVRFAQVFLVVPLAVLVALRTRRDAVVVLGSIVLLAVVQGVIGVVQALTGTGALINGEPVRAVGTFGAYNIAMLAGLCALALVICLGVAVVRRGPERVVALVVAAFLVFPLTLSLSRAEWVGAAVGAAVVLSRGRLVRFLAVLGTGALVAVLVVPPLAASDTDLGRRLGSLLSTGTTPDQSFIDRLKLWSAAAEMAVDNPWTGVGPRAFVDHRDAYAGLGLAPSSDIGTTTDFQQVALESPHNFALLVASEQGLLAAAAYLTVFGALLARGLVRSARHRSDTSTAVALAATGALALQLTAMINGDLGGPGSITAAVVMGLAGWAAADVDLLDGPSPERNRDGGVRPAGPQRVGPPAVDPHDRVVEGAPA